MTVPYNFKSIEKKWHEHIENMLKNDMLPLVQKRKEIIQMHEQRMKKKLQFPRDLYWDYGRDAVFLYEIFAEPEQTDAMWDDGGLDGSYRFLTRFWRTVLEECGQKNDTSVLRNQLIHEVQTRLDKKRPGTVVSVFMEYTRRFQEQGMDIETIKTVLILFAPFAPYIVEELWQKIGMKDNVFVQEWPVADEEILEKSIIEIPIQVNGKVYDVLKVSATCSEQKIVEKGKELVKERLRNGILKEIYIPGRILSFQVKEKGSN